MGRTGHRAAWLAVALGWLSACDGTSSRAGRADAGDGGADAGADAGMAGTGAFVEDYCEDEERGPGLVPRCGFVSVPERHGDPAGKSIRVRVAIFPAVGDGPPGAPVVLLDGPAGGSSITSTVYFGAWATDKPLRNFMLGRPLVAIDLRGAGGGVPALRCAEAMAIRPLPAGAEGMLELPAAAIEACRAEVLATGADHPAYGTAAAAADVERVVAALGHQRYDVLGVSYGARVALELVRRAPAGLRAVVLDSLVPPGVDALAEEAPALARALEVVYQRCEANPACVAAVPDVRGALAEIAQRLEALPVEVDSHGGAVRLDGRSFVQAVALTLRDGDGQLARRLGEARAGDFGYFAAVLGVRRARGSVGAHLGVVCREAMAFSSVEAIEARAATAPAPLGLALTARFYALACPIWNLPPAEAGLRQPVSAGLPVLLLNGDLDPLTAPSWAQAAAATLPGARVHALPEQGHGVVHRPCGARVAARFFSDPTAPMPSPDCQAASE